MVNTIVGPPARGKKYFERPYLTELLWESFEKGNNILLSAPRRIGKTSLICYLFDNPKPTYRVIYFTTESLNEENEFFKRMYNEILNNLERLQKHSKKVTTFLKSQLSRIDEIKKDGIKLGESKINYFNEINKLLGSDLFEGNLLIILVDEFAQTLDNIIRKKGELKAIQFLESNRELRHNLKISSNVRFLYTGSISLSPIVERLNVGNTINDLNSFRLEPLTDLETEQFINQLLFGSGYSISKKIKRFIQKEVEWFIPYYIQIVIDEIDKIKAVREKKIITEQSVKDAINQTLKNRSYFSHWVTRLKKVIKKADLKFALDLLNTLSGSEFIESSEIINKANKYKNLDSYKNVINTLIDDGYINNIDDSKKYKFNSPILKLWWNKNVAN